MSTNTIDYSIVIPTFNGEKLLKKNLPKVISIFPNIEIIVVDDGSVDKTPSVLSKLKVKSKKLKVIKNEKNYGFSTAANRGVMAVKTPLVFLLNNDCVPKKNFINIIFPNFKDKKTFAVSCLEKTDKGFRGRGIGGFRQGLLYHKPGKLDKNNTLWAFGAASFYNREIFLKLGGFDENFNPFYWEDFDLSYRALKSGYKIYFEKKTVVYHQKEATINKYYSPFSVKVISFRNQLITCWKDLTDKKLILLHLIWLPYHLIITTIKTRGVFLTAFFGALLKIIQILNVRKKNHFILSDKQVLKPFKQEILC